MLLCFYLAAASPADLLHQPIGQEKESSMSNLPANEPFAPDGEADKQADAMRDQLRKDVAAWSSAKAEGPGLPSPGLASDSGTAARPPARQSAPRARRPAAAVQGDAASRGTASRSAANEPAKKKPFGMSYDGVSQSDYIDYIISRGAR
jgi:hypothetical protein